MSMRSISTNQVVLDGCSSSSSLHDVIIVVEKTSALGSYIPELKASYLLPTLENFNGGPFDDKDYGSLSTSSAYSLVTFEAGDHVSQPLFECYGPYTSPQKIVSLLDKIQFQDGAGEFHSQIADGLAAALFCLDDISLLREPGLTPNKHCILICNSPPYNMPVIDVPGYQELGLEQLSTLMLERAVNLSIISPRKIPTLLTLFEKAGGDLGLMKNFSKDPRHLVLLRGFGLQERVPSPVPMQQSAPLDQQGLQYRQNQPRPQPTQQQPIQMQPLLRPGVQERMRLPMQQQPMKWQNTMQPGQMQPNQMQTPQMQGQLQQNPMQQQQQQQQQQQPGGMLPNQFQQNVQLQQQNPGMMQMKQLQQPGIMQPGMGMPMQQGVPVQGQTMQQNQQNTPQVIMASQQNQGMMQGGQQMQQQQQQQMQSQDGPAMQQASKERLLIWNGILEWQEKSSRPGDQNKVIRSVQCKISSAVLNGETEVKADNWPPKLLMQLIPKTLVSNLGGAYFKNARSVLFHPNPGEALDNLARVMSTGYAGCVHFNSSQTGQLCDIKVLMLLYSADKQAYVGFIPVDQAGFVERIRKVIQQQKNRQLGMNPEVPQPNQVLPGQPQPGVSGMMMTQNTNLGMGGGQMSSNQGQQDPNQIPQITLQANNSGMMANPSQAAQLVRPAGNTQQRQQQLMEQERQHNLMRIQQLQRELNEKQQREQLFQAQQEQQFTVVQIQNQPGMQQRPTGISVAGMQQNLQQQQQQRMMRPNVPTNPGLRHLLQQNPMGQARMGQPNMGGAMGGMNPQGPPFDDALFDLL